MDACDIAKQVENQHDGFAIAAVRAMVAPEGTPSRKTCCDCGEPIPEKRRELNPGCVHCVDCQAGLEWARGRARISE